MSRMRISALFTMEMINTMQKQKHGIMGYQKENLESLWVYMFTAHVVL